MTQNEALQRVMTDRPGEATEAELEKWLNDLDVRWKLEQIDTHWPTAEEYAAAQAAAEEEDSEESEETEEETEEEEEETDKTLLIQPPDDEVYIYWLYAKIDQRLGEIARYNNDAMLFNAAWDAAAKRWNRTHRYKGKQLRHVVYGSRPVPFGPEDPLNQRGDVFLWWR